MSITFDTVQAVLLVIYMLAVNSHTRRSDRRIDHLEGRVALLSSAFETTVSDDGVETITALKVPAVTAE